MILQNAFLNFQIPFCFSNYSASWSYQLAIIYTERIYRILEKFKLEWDIVCYCRVTHEFQSESTLYSLPECQGTPYLKQVPYLKFLSDSIEITST